MDLRFLRKILTDTEIEQVRGCENPDALLWSIWACKEAAYKALKKMAGDAVFIPCRWSVFFHQAMTFAGVQGIKLPEGFLQQDESTGFLAGEVITEENNIFSCHLFSSSSFVHGVVSDRSDILAKTTWRVEIFPEWQFQYGADSSPFGRSCLIHDLAEVLGVDRRQVEIRRSYQKVKELQPPVVYLQGARASAVDISLSHDGRFVAYAFVLLS